MWFCSIHMNMHASDLRPPPPAHRATFRQRQASSFGRLVFRDELHKQQAEAKEQNADIDKRAKLLQQQKKVAAHERVHRVGRHCRHAGIRQTLKAAGARQIGQAGRKLHRQIHNRVP